MNPERKISNLPPLVWKSVKSIEDQRRAALITSPSALAATGDLLTGINPVATIFISDSQKESAERLANNRIDSQVCYLVGGGQVADIGRYLAAAWNQEAVCVPTVISTDAFLVDSTGLRTGACVKYVKSKAADEVILDAELLSRAPRRYHLSGCGDVLSIFTGLFDWKYANDRGQASERELYDTGIAIMAGGILQGLLSETEEIKNVSTTRLVAIVNALAMEVQLCNLYGNSRPEEGGEHFFAYCIENKLPHFLHGEMVAFGVLLTGFLQGQDITQVRQFMDEIGLDYKPAGLNRAVAIETLRELPDYVARHRLRYGVYHDFVYQDRQKDVEEFFDLIGLKK